MAPPPPPPQIIAPKLDAPPTATSAGGAHHSAATRNPRASRRRSSEARASAYALDKKAPSTDPDDFGQTVLFTNQPQIVEHQRHRVYTAADLPGELDVLFIDEGEVRESLVRPTTAVVSNS